MNPLCVTVKPALPMPIGDENLERFINSGYDHIRVSPNPEVMQTLNRHGFIEMGFSVLRVASRYSVRCSTSR